MNNQIFDGAKIAVFEDRIIYEAMPPVTEGEIARIETMLSGPIPPELRELWSLCYGGWLDYDLDVSFGSHVHSFCFSMIFAPGGRKYHDLDGWIAHERERAQEEDDDSGDKLPLLDYLPIGGFEYLERAYVCVRPDDYGSVHVWSQGIPPGWTLRLHDDSQTRVADNLRAFFRMLDLPQDPFVTPANECDRGPEALGAIKGAVKSGALGGADAAALKALYRSAIADWPKALECGTLGASQRLARLALMRAAKTGDMDLLSRIQAQDVDIAQPLAGGGNLLDHALFSRQRAMAETLLDWGMRGGGQTIQCAAEYASPALLERLRAAGGLPNPSAERIAERAENSEAAALIRSWLNESCTGRE